ncbi:hypothetical protein HYFRA_00010992 [Hymenoscyphus fraxineus]|uniref:Uncharacterized protein n=1 Tax=Hymenoscyphus fraxineus TaxID=746836 RepID=A0A9N9KZ57_9HELO|nr:hypothetical protein HYFRA_00010992 [Hymenoscyphus fraxineus]
MSGPDHYGARSTWHEPKRPDRHPPITFPSADRNPVQDAPNSSDESLKLNTTTALLCFSLTNLIYTTPLPTLPTPPDNFPIPTTIPNATIPTRLPTSALSLPLPTMATTSLPLDPLPINYNFTTTGASSPTGTAMPTQTITISASRTHSHGAPNAAGKDRESIFGLSAILLLASVPLFVFSYCATLYRDDL